jgi:two-component system OmpR family sensor kinase
VSTPPDEVRGARWPQRLAADLLGVIGGCAAVSALLASDRVLRAVPLEPARLVLTFAAVAVGVAAAMSAVLAAQLVGDRGPIWFAAAVGVYAGVLVPWAVLVPGADPAGPLAATLLLLGMFALALRPPRWLGARGGWVLVGVGGAAVVGTHWLPVGVIERWPPADRLLTALVLAGWLAVAIGHLVGGHRARRPAELRVGLGLAVLAAVAVHDLLAAPAPGWDLAVAGLRLLGLVIVLVGVVQGARRALGALRAAAWQQQEELAAGALERERARERAAERDHELRNGLAGLAGITHLLSTDGGQHELLKHAVLAELGRLHLILDGGVDDLEAPDQADNVVDYLVEPVLTGLVTLRWPGVDRVRLRVEPGLRASGHPTVLAQVVTNLLANCDRHAPGAAVGLEAYRDGGVVVVAVRDAGPGLSGRLNGSVLDRGVRDESAGGSGLGLHISRQLIAREGGTLTLRSVDHPRGCLATVTVPAATAERRSALVPPPSRRRRAGH